MGHVVAIMKKQLKDTLKNKVVLLQVVLFPVLTWIMNGAVIMEDMPENFFVTLFATMYAGMAPLTSMAAIIAEEKETNTLRVLIFSNVKPHEYLLGVGIYVWAICMIGAGAICAAGRYDLQTGAVFLGILAVGILTSLLIGAAIGTGSRTQMMATSLTVPVMMAISFLPMLSMFNDTIAKIAKFTYSEQISRMLGQVGHLALTTEAICILCANILLAAALFAAAYKRCGLA